MGLYSERIDQIAEKTRKRDEINERRKKAYVKAHETSELVNFCKAGQYNKSRKDNKVIDMVYEWTTKRVSPVRFLDSHANLFVPAEDKHNPMRASKLRYEETRDRAFDIISGEPFKS